MMALRTFAAVIAVLLPAAASAANQCAMSAPDRAWIETSTRAWDRMATQRLGLQPIAAPTIVLFDARCSFEKAAGKVWKGSAHSGSVGLPDGAHVPVQVTSFAGVDGTGKPFFVMALPSVWDAAHLPISGDHVGLTGVFLHEFSHTRQTPVLKPLFDVAERLRPMPEDFSDDSLQKNFERDRTYAAAFALERDLLFQAAAEPDASKAKALAGQALGLMEARQKRWFRGEDTYWKAYDDLFLTMEGLGQWVAYAWLADPKGGGLEASAAMDKIRGSRRWWSQEEGLALFLVIDRFVPDWPEQAFGSKPALGIDLLRRAVGA